MQKLFVLSALVTMTGLGCAGSTPPSKWATGGARLDLVEARWAFESEPVELRARGDWAEVVVDGDVEWVLDRVGRVYDRHRFPVGVLEFDGRLVGNDEELLGVVGSSYAALPGKANAWLSIGPQGQVIQYQADGSQKPLASWSGCQVSPYAAQACLLAAYMILWEAEGSDLVQAAPSAPMSPGMMPLGVGMPIR